MRGFLLLLGVMRIYTEVALLISYRTWNMRAALAVDVFVERALGGGLQ